MKESSNKDVEFFVNGIKEYIIKIYIKYNKVKSEFMVLLNDNGSLVLQIILDQLSIFVFKFKFINKGKIVICDNIKDMFFNKVVFLVFGEIVESEDDLE